MSVVSKKTAFILSFLFPGLGHFYLRDFVDGGVFAAAAGLLWLALFHRNFYLLDFDGPRSLLVVLALGFIYLYAMIDGYRKAQ